MAQVLIVGDSKRERAIADALTRKTPVMITRRDGMGWQVYKSRFLRADPTDGFIVCALPTADDCGPFEVVGGEMIGISFRRGHKKCLFNTVVRPAGPGPALPHEGGFAVDWPEELQELQRRVYQRAEPPKDRPILVRIHPDAGESGSPCAKGVVADISAGGVRIRTDQAAHLEVGCPVTLAFQLRAREPEFEVDARFRHRESKADGPCALGFQFVGLETTREGQQQLARIARMVTDFQRAQMRRRRPNLRENKRPG